MKQLVAIVGPTGVGKSTLAMTLAPLFHGEIIGCDSRQIYRYMDIGTAKPGPDEMKLLPHYLIDIINPDEKLSLAQYQTMAYSTINEIHSRNGVPFIVGGTGQYFRAVIEGWDIPVVAPDMELRHKLEAEAIEHGINGLYSRLKEIDPEGASGIDPRNVRRVIRALEVYQIQGVPFSKLRKKNPPPYQSLIIGLTLERKELYRRVDNRVDLMIERGLVAEVAKLLEMGFSFSLPAMSGIGYKQIGEYLQGRMSMEDAIARIKYETHRYIRQQYAWFSLKDERIHWFDVKDDLGTDIIKLTSDFYRLNKL
jgi:tRNA dimethylallyltransferase